MANISIKYYFNIISFSLLLSSQLVIGTFSVAHAESASLKLRKPSTLFSSTAVHHIASADEAFSPSLARSNFQQHGSSTMGNEEFPGREPRGMHFGQTAGGGSN